MALAKKRKKNSDDDENAAGRFMESLVQQLISETEDANAVLESSNLEEVLRRVTEDLPSGKLRSALLQRVNDRSFVVDLRDAIKATCATTTDSGLIQDERTSVSLHPPGDSSSAEGFWNEVERGWAVRGRDEDLSVEVCRRFLSHRDPSLDVIWAIAAKSLRWDGNESEKRSALLSTKSLLRCLKPLIVGHTTAPTAVAALAPVAVAMFEVVQESSKLLQLSVGERDTAAATSYFRRAQKLVKPLQTMVREMLSFIAVCRSKKESLKSPSPPTSGPRLSASLSVLSSLLRSVQLDTGLARSDALAVTEQLNLLFPFFPYSIVKPLKRPLLKLDKLSELVTVEFVVLQLMLEVMNWRNSPKVQVEKTEALPQRFTARMRMIAIQGVAAADSRNDVILDLLLAGLSIAKELLDEKDRGFLHALLYRALLVEDLQMKDEVIASTSKMKICKTFLKKVAVARSTNDGYRLLNEQNQLLHLLYRLHVPSEFFQWLKTTKIKQKPQINAALSSPQIIGWLLKLEDTDFKEVVDKGLSSSSKRLWDHQEQTSEGDDPCNGAENHQNCISARNSHSQIGAKAFFFVDTVGDGKQNSSAEGKPITFVSAGKEGEGN